MFSFHKPRVYRSTEGCCICRAKSSSSRFTDSKKYEDDSVKCFNLDIPRQGEICNACVLLVKRFKRLPTGSTRHWGHVVDARIGPGMKSMTKFKKLKEESGGNQKQTGKNTSKVQNGKSSSSSSIPEKFCKIFKKTKKKPNKEKLQQKEKQQESTPATWDDQSLPPTPESMNSDCEENIHYSNYVVTNRGKIAATNNKRTKKNRRKSRKPQKLSNRKNPLVGTTVSTATGNFIDENLWRRVKSCCGIVYENLNIGAVIIDSEHYNPCMEHKRKTINVKNSNFIQGSSSSITTNDAKKTEKNSIMIKPITTATSNFKTELKRFNGMNEREKIECSSNKKLLPSPSLLPPPVVGQASAPVKWSISTGTPNLATAIAAKTLQTIETPVTTPALKKHHLFFKRQMESLARAENSSNTIINSTKTDSTDLNNKQQSQQQQDDFVCSQQKIQLTTISVDHVTKSKPTLLHKLKADTGRIVKHSLDKMNNTLKLKQNPDLNDMKNLIRINDNNSASASSAIITGTIKLKSVNETANSSNSNSNNITNNHLNIRHNHNSNVNSTNNNTKNNCNSTTIQTGKQITETTAGPKFNDNSSDSGFDENLQDRKSASPMQEEDDKDKRILIRPPTGSKSATTMFLANGIQIQAPPQSIILAGNEVAAKMIHCRRQQHQQQSGIKHIAQVSANENLAGSISSINTGSQKICAIYTPPAGAGTNIGGNSHHYSVGTSSSSASVMGSSTSATISGNPITGNGSVASAAGGGTTILNITTPTAVTNLNQKIILVKTKYNNNNNSNINSNNNNQSSTTTSSNIN